MKKRFRVFLALTYNDPLYHQGVMEFANEAGWELDLTASYYGTHATEAIRWKGDGVITHYLPGNSQLMVWVRQQKIPVVSINADEAPYWPGTAPDHKQCGVLAAEHFLSLGLKELAFFRCSSQVAIRERQDSFFHTIKTHGGNTHLLDWRFPPTRNTTVVLGRMIKALPKPLGILCQTDRRASEIFNACEEVGLRVPEEVAVLGIGNNEKLCGFSRIPLSSVDTDMRQTAKTGAMLLDQLMRRKTIPKNNVIIPPIGVVQRRSTAVVQIPHPGVAKAMLFIMEHLASPINAHDVIQHVGMSRSGLRQAFEKYVGRPLSEEILRVKLEYAKHLLLSCDMKIYEIAEAAGFSSYTHFAKSFRRTVGLCVSEFLTRRAKQ